MARKYFRLLFTIIVSISAILFSVSSCTKDDAKHDNRLIGTWREQSSKIWGDDDTYNGEHLYQFNKNGSCIEIYSSKNGTWVYRVKWQISQSWQTSYGNLMTILNEDGEEESGEMEIYPIVEITENSFTLSELFFDSAETVFVRVSDESINRYL